MKYVKPVVIFFDVDNGGDELNQSQGEIVEERRSIGRAFLPAIAQSF